MTKLGAHQMGDFGIDSMNRGLRRHLTKAQAITRRLSANLRHFDFLRSSVSHFTLLITSLFLIMFFGLLWTTFKSDYHTALRHAEETTQSVGTLTEAHLDSLFGGTASLLELIDRASQTMTTGELVSLAREAEASSDNIHRILVTGPMGRPLDAASPSLSPSETLALNAATAANWSQRDGAAQAVFPSSTSLDGYFSLTQRLEPTGGAERFAIALVSQQAANAFLSSSILTTLPGRAGTVSLVAPDGKIFSVHPRERSSRQIIALEDVITRSGSNGATLDYIDLSEGSFLFARRATEYGTDIMGKSVV